MLSLSMFFGPIISECTFNLAYSVCFRRHARCVTCLQFIHISNSTKMFTLAATNYIEINLGTNENRKHKRNSKRKETKKTFTRRLKTNATFHTAKRMSIHGWCEIRKITAIKLCKCIQTIYFNCK